MLQTAAGPGGIRLAGDVVETSGDEALALICAGAARPLRAEPVVTTPRQAERAVMEPEEKAIRQDEILRGKRRSSE